MCAQLIPLDSSSKVNLFVHSEFVDSNFSSTIKLLLRNDSSTTVKIEQGTSSVQALILPILYPTLIYERRFPDIFFLNSNVYSRRRFADLDFFYKLVNLCSPQSLVPIQTLKSALNFLKSLVQLWRAHEDGLGTTAVVKDWMAVWQFQALCHPPYSPELVPADFFMISKLKNHLPGKP